LARSLSFPICLGIAIRWWPRCVVVSGVGSGAYGANGNSTVHEQVHACDERCCIAQQEHHRSGHFVWFARSSYAVGIKIIITIKLIRA
jgi:hypothetical protein